MTDRGFFLTAVVGITLAVVCLIAATVLDSAVLAVVGAVLVLAVLVAREGWLWAGHGRQWVGAMAALALVVFVAFLAQRLAG